MSPFLLASLRKARTESKNAPSSDGVLNPGGVRFGSAELYAVVEEMEEVDDCIAVGQKLPDGDERV